MSLEPGSSLGPYRIEAPIGAGGMGSVWKARDTRLNRTVVLANPEAADKLKFASLLSISIFAALCSAGGGLLGFLSQSRGPSI